MLPCSRKKARVRYIEFALVEAVARAAADKVTGTRYTGPVTAAVALCARHRRRPFVRAGICATTGAAATVSYMYLAPMIGTGEFDLYQATFKAVTGFVGFCAVLIGFLSLFDRTSVWFTPTGYFDRYVWVKGAGRAFLATLPTVKKSQYDPKAEDTDDESVAEERKLSADELIRRAGDLDD